MDKISVTAIISEFNPFHNGHYYLVNQIKNMAKNSFTVAVMTGNFSQRAEPSIISKWAKAKCALISGIDLVIEMPVIWSIASAQYFARAGVFLANSLGIVDNLCFGSESGDIKLLRSAASAAYDPNIQNCIKELLKSGISYPKARYLSVKKFFDNEVADVLNQPNNILAVEYIRAIDELNSHIKPSTVERAFVNHDSVTAENNFASASFIRELILKNDLIPVKNLMPKAAHEVLKKEIELKNAPADINLIGRAILMKIRSASCDELNKIIDVNEGLDRRIYKKARTACSLEQLYNEIKTKRYTYSRIRRIILAAVIGVTSDVMKLSPGFIRVLGFNEKGRYLLKLARKASSVPIIIRPKDILKLDDTSKAIFDIEQRATDIYSLATEKIRPCNLDITTNPVIII